MSGNQDSKVDFPLSMVTGPVPGDGLFDVFKSELIKERVFQTMFGLTGERVFIHELPALNETVLPAILLSWKSENFKTNNVYLEGTVSGTIFLPTQLRGDYNALRKVGSILQRWMGGSMSLFDKVPGLTQFGFGTDFNYDKTATFTGMSCPMIEMIIPYKFDLQLLRLQSNGFDASAPLDDSDVGFIEGILLEVINGETNDVIFEEGVLVATGQTN